MSKGLDLWIGSLREDAWAASSSPTQFMKKRSSYELAILLLSEAILYSTKTLRKDLWCLFLDKQSAFDLVLKEHVIRADLFAAGGPGAADQTSLYLANRLAHRLTFLQYGPDLMGPIQDKAGVE